MAPLEGYMYLLAMAGVNLRKNAGGDVWNGLASLSSGSCMQQKMG